MSGGFQDPVVGGQALRIPSIRSPNFLTGVSGWTINKDGSAEFNNGVFRGTVTAAAFIGTDFVINTSGQFFYDGTPAQFNLIVSIAPQAGTDAFGNPYLAGIATYDTGGNTGLLSYTLLNKDAVSFGAVTAGVFQAVADAAGISGNTTGMNTFSGIDPANPTGTADSAGVSAVSGASGAGTGTTTAPFVQMSDALGTSAQDLLLSGSLRQTDLSGTPLTWQTVSLVTGWSAAGFSGDQTFQYTRDNLNRLVLDGELKAPAVAAGTSTSILSTPLPAAYRPTHGRRFPIYQSTGAAGTYATGIVHSDGNIFVQNPTALALNDIVSFSIALPLGALP